MSHSPLFFFNTLTRTKEEFVAILPNQVRVYSCGPTVYDYVHIGNMRSYIFADILRRTLEKNNYTVTQVINITDVGEPAGGENGEDKVEKAAKAKNQTVAEITAFYTDSFLTDLKKLNIKTTDTEFPRASLHIAEQIELIKKLEAEGYAYQTTSGIYFDTAKYPAYAELGKLNLSGQHEGARVEVNTEKRNPTDFALWKFSAAGETRLQEWSSPWGVGFPGWHIECSAMSMKYLGEHFDIHTGGEDHIPVHHTNERAQSECATGKPFVNYWLHNAFITVDGQKMAKSEKNFYTLADLASQGHSPLAYRYFVLGAHYRSPLNFTFEALVAAEKAWQKINDFIYSAPEGGEVDQPALDKFTEAINDDLNTAKALAVLHDTLNSALSAEIKRATIEEFDQVLSILSKKESVAKTTSSPIPEEILSLVQDREVARERSDWARADLIRAEIENQGYSVKDTPHGPETTKLS